MNEKQLAKLIRKNAQKAEQNAARARRPRGFDPTLDRTTGSAASAEDADIERNALFKEMKRREF